jgi:hypothetical protein
MLLVKLMFVFIHYLFLTIQKNSKSSCVNTEGTEINKNNLKI